MRRNNPHRSVTMLYPLIGLAAALSLPGCAAAPVISLASQMMHQPATGGASTSSTDMIASLAQRVGFMLPAQPGTATGGTAASATAATASSGKAVTQ